MGRERLIEVNNLSKIQCSFLLNSTSLLDASPGSATDSPSPSSPLAVILQAVRDSLGDVYEELATKVVDCPPIGVLRGSCLAPEDDSENESEKA